MKKEKFIVCECIYCYYINAVSMNKKILMLRRHEWVAEKKTKKYRPKSAFILIQKERMNIQNQLKIPLVSRVYSNTTNISVDVGSWFLNIIPEINQKIFLIKFKLLTWSRFVLVIKWDELRVSASLKLFLVFYCFSFFYLYLNSLYFS